MDPRLYFAQEVARFVRRNLPGGSLWYARAALDHLVHDRIQEILDPNYARSFQRMRDRLERDTGQHFFFGPGDTGGPTRLPDLGAAIGGAPAP